MFLTLFGKATAETMREKQQVFQLQDSDLDTLMISKLKAVAVLAAASTKQSSCEVEFLVPSMQASESSIAVCNLKM